MRSEGEKEWARSIRLNDHSGSVAAIKLLEEIGKPAGRYGDVSILASGSPRQGTGCIRVGAIIDTDAQAIDQLATEPAG